jgi:hypothetical protein
MYKPTVYAVFGVVYQGLGPLNEKASVSWLA